MVSDFRDSSLGTWASVTITAGSIGPITVSRSGVASSASTALASFFIRLGAAPGASIANWTSFETGVTPSWSAGGWDTTQAGVFLTTATVSSSISCSGVISVARKACLPLATPAASWSGSSAPSARQASTLSSMECSSGADWTSLRASVMDFNDNVRVLFRSFLPWTTLKPSASTASPTSTPFSLSASTGTTISGSFVSAACSGLLSSATWMSTSSGAWAATLAHVVTLLTSSWASGGSTAWTGISLLFSFTFSCLELSTSASWTSSTLIDLRDRVRVLLRSFLVRTFWNPSLSVSAISFSVSSSGIKISGIFVSLTSTALTSSTASAAGGATYVAAATFAHEWGSSSITSSTVSLTSVTLTSASDLFSSFSDSIFSASSLVASSTDFNDTVLVLFLSFFEWTTLKPSPSTSSTAGLASFSSSMTKTSGSLSSSLVPLSSTTTSSTWLWIGGWAATLAQTGPLSYAGTTTETGCSCSCAWTDSWTISPDFFAVSSFLGSGFRRTCCSTSWTWQASGVCWIMLSSATCSTGISLTTSLIASAMSFPDTVLVLFLSFLFKTTLKPSGSTRSPSEVDFSSSATTTTLGRSWIDSCSAAFFSIASWLLSVSTGFAAMSAQDFNIPNWSTFESSNSLSLSSKNGSIGQESSSSLASFCSASVIAVLALLLFCSLLFFSVTSGLISSISLSLSSKNGSIGHESSSSSTFASFWSAVEMVLSTFVQLLSWMFTLVTSGFSS